MLTLWPLESYILPPTAYHPQQKFRVNVPHSDDGAHSVAVAE